jgi:hypothetical protein
MDWKELMLLAFLLISVVSAIAVPVGIHLSNNNKKSVPTNTPEPGGTGPPVPPPIVPLPIAPQSGQAPPVPPPVPPQSGQPPPEQPQSGQVSVVPPPIVPLPIAPQSGQASLVPPVAPQSVPKKYTYVRGARNESQTWGCQLKDGNYSSVYPYEIDQLEGECSERVDCFGYYKADSGWLISTNADPKDCKEQPAPWEKYPYFYLKKEVEG